MILPDPSTVPPPLLVAGMHNSGTSLVAEVLHESGVFMGANMPHHESHFFTIFVNDRLILGEKSRWAKLPLPTIAEVEAIDEEIARIVRDHWLPDYVQWGYDGVSPWGVKDPRLCILLPFYLRLFPGAKVLHVHRNPADVAASLSRKAKRGVGVLSDPAHWEKLADAYTERVREYGPKAGEYLEIEYDDYCRDPAPLTEKMLAFAGVAVTDEIRAFLAERVHTRRIGTAKRSKLRWRLGAIAHEARKRLKPKPGGAGR